MPHASRSLLPGGGFFSLKRCRLILVLLALAGPAAGLVLAPAAPVQRPQPASGHVHALTVFARFADETGDEEVPEFAGRLFDAGLPGSLTHFYTEMSRGQFLLTGELLPRWYSARREASAYVAPAGNYGAFVREILQAVDGDVDLGRYDSDGPDGVPNSGDDDGYVDFLFIVTRSAPRGFIVDAATGIASLGLGSDFFSGDPAQRGGFVRVRADAHSRGVGGTVQQGSNFAMAVGSMAHEFGHFLRLPDLYDLSFDVEEVLGPSDDSAGIGYWGIMGHGNRGWGEEGGPNPFCSWSLAQLGWLGQNNEQLVVVDRNMDGVVFEDVNAGGKVYMLPTGRVGEFFLVEYRARTHSYYERNLPAEGLLVWRINANRTNNDEEAAKLVDLVCADGLYSDAGFPLGQIPSPVGGRDNLDFWAHDEAYRNTHEGNLGDATDVFDGERFTEFWVASNPAAPSRIGVTGIRRQGERMVADLRVEDQRRAGPVLGEETWADTIDVVGDVVVQAGARLSIEPGTWVRFGADLLGTGRDPALGELVVHGELNVNFSSRDSTYFVGRDGADWYGIRVGEVGSLVLRKSILRGPQVGIEAGSLRRALWLEEVSIERSAGDGIRVEQAHEQITLIRVQVQGSGGVGAHIGGSGLTRVSFSALTDNGLAGLVRQGGFVEVTDSQFQDNGLEDGEGANLVLGPDVFGRVESNRFAGGVGIRCVETREVVISQNALNNNRIGLVSISARPRITGNQFNRSDLALQIAGFAVPARLDLNVVQGAEQLLSSEAAREVVATNNWWGRTDEAWIAEHIDGQVLWRPFLNFDPRIPLAFALAQNYPNPFNGSTVIDYQISINEPIVAGRARTVLEIRTITGGLVRRLVEQPAAPGFYRSVWDGRDEEGRRVASGTYYYQLTVGPVTLLQKLVFLK